jgi:hypothetical protein
LDPKTLAILGSALSALIAALGYYAKTRQERLRTTRSVLFQLLEMRHQLAILQYMSGKFLKDYLAACQSILGPKGVNLSAADMDSIETVGRKHFRRFATKQLMQLNEDVFKPYKAALEQLAKDEPVLAFRLRGKESFMARTPAAEALFDIPLDDNVSALAHEIKTAMVSDIEDLVRESTLEDITEATKMVALQCGLLTYAETWLV